MKTIWKYQLDIADEQTVSMKRDAQILAVQVQGGIACLWALVESSELLERRTFRLYGTGHPVDDEPGQYVGTFQLHDGALMFHIFDTTPRVKEGVA